MIVSSLQNGPAKRVNGNRERVARVLRTMVRNAARHMDLNGLTRRMYSRPEELGTLAPYIASGLVALVVAVHALFGFDPALEALYLVPVWLAFRWGGVASGLSVSALSALAASLVNADRLTPLSLGLRLCAYAAFAVVCLRSERRIESGVDRGTDRFEEETVVAVQIDCEGFDELDAIYGERAGSHVQDMLLRVLQNETRTSDMIAKTGDREYVVVLSDMNGVDAQRLMDRVQERFERLVLDAGYECTIHFGCTEVEEEPHRIQDLIRQTQPNPARPYLN